jgi:cyclic pyranopterin phosphate synthase
MSAETVAALRGNTLDKGDALGAARIAGIMAAKRTHELIPLCHPLAITGVEVSVELTDGGAEIRTSVKTTDRTGVEMEALVAASVAALTLYDMAKSTDKGITIEQVRLTSKTGGKSGDFRADG